MITLHTLLLLLFQHYLTLFLQPLGAQRQNGAYDDHHLRSQECGLCRHILSDVFGGVLAILHRGRVTVGGGGVEGGGRAARHIIVSIIVVGLEYLSKLHQNILTQLMKNMHHKSERLYSILQIAYIVNHSNK